MKPILPREFLWTNKKTMDEFFELDPINEEFFDVFIKLREEPFAVTAGEVKVFNEVYYQLTRMVFEHPLPSDLDNYITDIKANLGWNYSAELVMSMAYFLLSLVDKQVRPLNKFFTKSINERFFGCLYWKPFKHRFEHLKKQQRKLRYNFQPCPVDVWYLQDKYVDWKTITRGFDLGCMDDVINLWSTTADKKEVAWMINDTSAFPSNENNRILRFLNIYMLEDDNDAGNMCAEPLLDDYGHEALRTRLTVMEIDREKLKNRINELEAENERLNALLEKKKSKGKARRFTLVEIVDYCKRRVEWNDAKDIVAMLNWLLRKIGTQEDSSLVDSIESEFLNRKYGHVTMNNPQFSGPMYDVKGNNNVNIGGNGKESK